MDDPGSNNALQACRTPAYGVHDGAQIVHCSDELARMLGAPSASDVVGREMLTYVAPEYRDDFIAAVLNHRDGPYRSVGLKSGGDTFPAEVTAAWVRRGSGVSRLFLIRDLSPIALVVDDEPGVARMTASLLRGCGYQTAIYTNPARALAHYQPGWASIIISDVVMPEMSGFAMVEHIRTVDPDAPVIFTSGYTEQRPPVDNATLFLPKPFGMRHLTELLARLPERARTPAE